MTPRQRRLSRNPPSAAISPDQTASSSLRPSQVATLCDQRQAVGGRKVGIERAGQRKRFEHA